VSLGWLAGFPKCEQVSEQLFIGFRNSPIPSHAGTGVT
jgi:hypothetical protein